MSTEPKQPPPAEAYYDIFEEIKTATQAFYTKDSSHQDEPTYWDEKKKDRREEFKEEDARSRGEL